MSASVTVTPVLLVLFNRPELTRRAFERIRQARPARLYVVADGPRADRPGEGELCERARAEVRVDWPCDVVHDLSPVNLGCKRRVSSGISAAFEREERLIVVEDDCVADPSFFPYCDELLERYAGDPRVMAISGDNFQRGGGPRDHSYYFSRYPHCWGWATWRRAWRGFDPDLRAWPRLRRTAWLAGLFGDESARAYWTCAFDAAYAAEVDSWAYPWTLACWLRGGLTALPAVNLVENIGHGPEATHTKEGLAPRAARLEGPLRHPPAIVRDAAADAFTQVTHFEGRRPGLRERARARVPRSLARAVARARGRAAAPAADLARLEPLRDAPRAVPGRTTFRGLALEYLDGPSLYWQLHEVFIEGCYDVDLPAPAPRILDLGGNVGLAALRLRQLAPDARLTVYEADPALARALERNLRAAGDASTEVVPRAVWTHDGEVSFSGRGDDAGRVAPHGGRRVPCVDVAALCREPIDLLKMDVEGAEHELLPRLEATGALANVRRLVVECHVRADAPRRLDELLACLARGGLQYRVLRAVEHPDLDPSPSASGFAAVRSRGALCLVYAWHAGGVDPAAPAAPGC